MKKLILFLLVMCSLFLVSCEKEMYTLTLTGSSDHIINKLKSSYEYNEEVVVKIPIIHDASLYVFLNGEEIEAEFSEEERAYIFRFNMPRTDSVLHLTFDNFYGVTNTTFDDVFWWVSRVNNLIEVVSTERPKESTEFITVKYSIDSTDLNNYLSMFDEELLRYDPEELNFNGHTDVLIKCSENESHEIRFIDNYIEWYDFSSSQLFKFSNSNYNVPSITNPYKVTYKFKYNGRSSDLKRIIDDKFISHYTSIESIEFVPYEGSEEFEEASYYLDSNYGKIELIDDNHFKLNDKYYEIVNAQYWAYKLIN